MRKLGKKIATVAIALAATVMLAAPASALAVTAPNKGCPANTANGYHNYVYKCTGNKVGTRSASHTYGLFTKKTCKTTQDLYNCVELCDLCGLNLGVRYVLHGHDVRHNTCGGYDESWCGGAGSYVTYLR